MIGDVHGLGLLLGIELVKDRSTRERAVDEAEAMKKKGKVSSPKRCFYAPVAE